MYWETLRLAFIAIGIVIIIHLSLQIYEEKTRPIIQPNMSKTVYFADEVNNSRGLVEYEAEAESEAESSLSPAPVMHEEDEPAVSNTRPNQSYYADLKQELQEWVQTENSDWGATQPPAASPQLTMQTSLEDIQAKQQHEQKQKLQKQTEPPNVQIKLNMVRDAARSPNVPKTIDCKPELDANIVPPKTPLEEDNIMNSGILGGGLSAWDVTGDTYGMVNE